MSVCLENRVVASTLGDIAISPSADLDLTRISPCNHEKADTHLLLQFLVAAKTRAKSAMINTA